MSIGLSASPFQSAIPPTVSVTATHDEDGTIHLYPIPFGATISPADAVRLGEYFLQSQPQIPSDDTGDAAETLAPVDAEPTPAPDSEPVADPTPVEDVPPVADPDPVSEPVADPTPVEDTPPAAEPIVEPAPEPAPVDTPAPDTTPPTDTPTSVDPDSGIQVADPAPVEVADQPEVVAVDAQPEVLEVSEQPEITEVADQAPVNPTPVGWPSDPNA